MGGGLCLAPPAVKDRAAPLLPDIAKAADVADSIALVVANKAREQGVSRANKNVDFKKILAEQKWAPVYLPYRAV